MDGMKVWVSSRYNRNATHMSTQRLAECTGPAQVSGREGPTGKRGKWILVAIPNHKAVGLCVLLTMRYPCGPSNPIRDAEHSLCFLWWEKVGCGMGAMVLSLLCTQRLLGYSWDLGGCSKFHTSPQGVYTPGRKGKAETRKGQICFVFYRMSRVKWG